MAASVLVQYILLRGDLKWPLGALVVQGCHASTAVLHQFYDDEFTKAYLSKIDEMHKIVLACKTESDLLQTRKVLLENDIKHKLWIEMPENIPTCLALKPYPKDEVQQFFKNFKLFK